MREYLRYHTCRYHHVFSRYDTDLQSYIEDEWTDGWMDGEKEEWVLLFCMSYTMHQADCVYVVYENNVKPSMSFFLIKHL